MAYVPKYYFSRLIVSGIALTCLMLVRFICWLFGLDWFDGASPPRHGPDGY